jgi:anhydro-N-acetylmuramic acid kinase
MRSRPLIRHVVGVMTGTSIDGIDAALARVDGRGLDMKATLIASASRTLGSLGDVLRRAASQQPMTTGQMARLAWQFGKLHLQVVSEIATLPTRVDLICVHGQTVYHQPPYSWQLVNPAPLLELGAPIVFDLRQADLAAGGQGAPITPIADWILFRRSDRSRAIVNLGGFCNATLLPQGRAGGATASTDQALRDIQGFDVCACNQLLDAVARRLLGASCDKGGAAALSGTADPKATEALRKVLQDQQLSQRSLGTGDEADRWIDSYASKLRPEDMAASAVQAIAHCVTARINDSHAAEVILAGGGARNVALVGAIRAHCAAPVILSDDCGVPHHAREALCFAVLGALCADGVPITLPQVTGCRSPAPLAGYWCVGLADREFPPRG